MLPSLKAKLTAELIASIENDIQRLTVIRNNIAAGGFEQADIDSLQVAAAGCHINAEDYTCLLKK